MNMFEEDFVPLTPVNFFHINSPCHATNSPLTEKNYQSYLLPDTSSLCNEYPFAEVALGWHNEGLEAYILIKQAFHQVYYPEIARGDSVELFFDTRDVKTSGWNTRFCHHFFFLPEAIDGHQAGEITKFRTEDVHELCNAKELKVKSQIKQNRYMMQIFIPQQCLHGYDPAQFNRLGFTYRINRASGKSQHFSVVTDEFQMEQQPSLWSSLTLIK